MLVFLSLTIKKLPFLKFGDFMIILRLCWIHHPEGLWLLEWVKSGFTITTQLLLLLLSKIFKFTTVVIYFYVCNLILLGHSCYLPIFLVYQYALFLKSTVLVGFTSKNFNGIKMKMYGSFFLPTFMFGTYWDLVYKKSSLLKAVLKLYLRNLRISWSIEHITFFQQSLFLKIIFILKNNILT